MTGLALMNPWHAARTLLSPEVPESAHISQYQGLSDGRQERSVIDELIPLGPEFVKTSKFRAVGPMFKRKMLNEYPLEDFGPKYVGLIEDPTVQKKNMEIMRFGKRDV